MISRTGFIIANALMFQIGWFICVLYGDLWATLSTGIALALHFYFSSCRRQDLLALAIALAIGLAHDSILIALGHLHFAESSSLPPLWLVCLWALLGITLNHSLAWIYQRFWLSAALGIIAGPLSYIAGIHLSTADWGTSMREAVPVIAFMWMLVLPLHRFIYSGIFKLSGVVLSK